jgi:hypothetical protein
VVVNTKDSLDTLLLNEETFAWATGVALRGFSVNSGSGGWKITFRGRLSNGACVYATTVNADMREGVYRLLTALSQRDGNALWHHDRYGA